MELRYTRDKVPARSFEVRTSLATVLSCRDSDLLFQLISGRVCPVEEILSKQPGLKVLRDPPSLAGQRVRFVMMFRFDPGNTAITRCKVRAQAWTDPSLHLGSPVDKVTSMFLAESVFDAAKVHFEKSDPDKIRAGDVRNALQPES